MTSIFLGLYFLLGIVRLKSQALSQFAGPFQEEMLDKKRPSISLSSRRLRFPDRD